MRTSTIFTVAGVTLVTGAVAYAIWFDSKRRSDADFRKKLRKEKKKVEKVAAQQQEQAATAAGGSTTVTQADLRAALEKIKSEPIPGSPEQKEAYFMEQVNNGESLCTQGPAFALPAAMCFFRALRVYPQPMELLQIYQGTVPEPVFKLMIEMTQLDVKTRIESYWDNFPPADMNVTVKPVDIADASGTINRKRVLVVNKDVSAGDVIYKETPVIGALDADLEGKGEYCSYCFKSTDPATAIRPSSDKLGSTYCSKEHELAATLEYQALLFGVESPVPADVDPTNTPESAAKRGEAQDKLVSMLKESGKIQPLLLARFLARVVSGELSKLFPGLVASAPAHIFGLTDFSFYDHMERLRYLELTVADDEMKALREVFQYTMAGLEQALDDEPYKTLKGKMAYNAYGVYHGEGRSDKPEPAGRPEDKERTRTSIGTSKQIGSAFYFLSSYIQHDCDPSAKITFPDGTGDLTLVAARDVKAGDELTVAFVDVSQHEGESVAEGRRRRRYELTRGWRFACPCKRCVAENEGGTDEPAVVHDESKVEKPIERHEAQEAETFAATVD